MKKTLFIIIALVLIAGAGYWIFQKNTNQQSISPDRLAHLDKIRVEQPLDNAVISSPSKVTGQARGVWYFEASFPVRLLDANGKELARIPAQAQGEWMTENFVPFTAELNFSQPSTDTGTLILEKDNPSGLPQNSDQLSIPIRFK